MTQESQYEYLVRKKKEQRLAEATANGNGYVVLQGGTPRFPLKEATRAAQGHPLMIPGEVLPNAARVDGLAPHTAVRNKAVPEDDPDNPTFTST